MLFALAIIPVIGLLLFIYFNDKKEKEPFGLLVALFFAGMGTSITAIISEVVGELFIDVIFSSESVIGSILYAIIIVAPAEELGKFLVLFLITWKNKHFNYSYDAIVYAVFVSLGFAALENIGYVFFTGWFTALVRMFTAVPGHACYAVFMGYFYSKAKYASVTKKKGNNALFIILAMLVPIVMHGVYDAILMAGNAAGELVFTGISFILWLLYITALFVVSIVFVILSSKHDFCIVSLPGELQTIYKPVYVGSWSCLCGSVNYLNFCGKCGRPRPLGYAWNCPRCGTLCALNFCGACGMPRPVQTAPQAPSYAPVPAYGTATAAVQPVTSVQPAAPVQPASPVQPAAPVPPTNPTQPYQ